MRIYITGMPGSGKTFLGKRLAKTLGLPFLDLDEFIERHTGKTIKNIIAEQGENAFRTIEHECLLLTSVHRDVVIACGGGTPAYFNNMQWIKQNGTSIWLKTDEEKILERILKNQSRRPMFANLSKADILKKIQLLNAERLPFYKRADIILSEEQHVEKTLNAAIQRLMKPIKPQS